MKTSYNTLEINLEDGVLVVSLEPAKRDELFYSRDGARTDHAF